MKKLITRPTAKLSNRELGAELTKPCEACGAFYEKPDPFPFPVSPAIAHPGALCVFLQK